MCADRQDLGFELLTQLTTLEDEAGNEVKILRDNMLFGRPGQGEFGTYFIGYARSPQPIEQMLENMFVGKPPGNYDRLLDFLRAVTGGLFFAPSATLLEELAERAPADQVLTMRPARRRQTQNSRPSKRKTMGGVRSMTQRA